MDEWEELPNFNGWWRHKPSGKTYAFHPKAMAIGELLFASYQKLTKDIKK